MRHELFDALIVGGGPAGLAMGASLGAIGARALCVDHAPLPQISDPAADLRSSALLRPSINILRKAGAWDQIAPYAQPMRAMRLIDCGGRSAKPRLKADFRADDLEEGVFGYNVPNAALRHALDKAISKASEVEHIAPMAVSSWVAREDGVRALLANGRRIHARLLIGADGRNSSVRQKAGIGVRKWRYAQKALVCVIAHDADHEGASLEFHRSHGPFTLAPMTGRRSGVVWMSAPDEIERLAALDEAEFNAALTAKSQHMFGECRLISRRAVWPIVAQRAQALSARRVALIAEAAHVMPPIGAQGLNLSLRDVEALSRLIENARARGADPGAAQTLSAYERARRADMDLRLFGVDLLNRAAMAEAQPLRDARSLALSTLYHVPPLRNMAIRLGLGG